MRHRQKQQIKKDLWTLTKVWAWLVVIGMAAVLALILFGLMAAL
jgi:hypothetical protein